MATIAATRPSTYAFDEPTHTYTVNGRPLLSVTQALHGAGLIDCSWFTDEARERGRKAHKAIHFDSEGDLDEEKLDSSLAGYVHAARAVKRELRLATQATEVRVWNARLGYAGTIDDQSTLPHLAGRQIEAIIDYKTGPVQHWARLQTAAYAGTFPNGSAYARYAVQLKQDGTYKITAYWPNDFRQDFADFLAALRIAQIRQQEGLLASL